MKRIAVIVVGLLLLLPVVVGAQSDTVLRGLAIMGRDGTDDSCLRVGRDGIGQDVFIIGQGVGPPSNLILTETNATTVTLTWTAGLNAANYMVRAAIGRVPTGRNDGYEVYYGPALTCQDDGSFHFEEMAGEVYYRVFSQHAWGFWETQGVSNYIGGVIMVLLLFGILGLGLTYGFFWKRSSFFAYGAAGAWALLGFQGFVASASTNPTQVTDTYMALFWLCIAFTIGCALLPTIMRERPEPEELQTDAVGDDMSSFLPTPPSEHKERE